MCARFPESLMVALSLSAHYGGVIIMSRQARQRSKTIRQARRAFQRVLRQARPLTEGEVTVVRHLLTPVRLQRHFSPDRDYYLQPNRYAWWYPYGPGGRHGGRSADLAR